MNMKKIIKILVITSLVFVSLLRPTSIFAWEDCPKGEVNDPYPGDCARYIDTDGNDICDHSESAPEDRAEKIERNSEEDIGIDADNATKTISDQEEVLFSKPLIVLAIVAVNLVGILVYVTYRNSKSKTL